MIAGETIAGGAATTCADCLVTPSFEVLERAPGFFIATVCDCARHTRESGYYRSEEDAEAAHRRGTFARR